MNCFVEINEKMKNFEEKMFFPLIFFEKNDI